MFQRISILPQKGHFFLFGARGTGKSTLLRSRFNPATTISIDFLDAETEMAYAREPQRLAHVVSSLAPLTTAVIVDEIQKVPRVLDVIHQLIEAKRPSFQFVLTGSSARKLKHGGANLLAGRAVVRHLYPLFDEELAGTWPIETVLQYGTLPGIVCADESARDDHLRAYANMYVKEEVISEQLVRNLDGFRRFLPVAAQMSGKIINATAIAKDVNVDVKTVQGYYSILEDTLLGFHLEAWHQSVRKRHRHAPKFYFFDPGVSRALAMQLRVFPQEGTSYFGELFEQHVIREFVHRNAAFSLDLQFGYSQLETGAEVDLVVRKPDGRVTLIEIKSTSRVEANDAKTLLKFASVFPKAEMWLLSRDSTVQQLGPVRAMPWTQGVALMTSAA